MKFTKHLKADSNSTIMNMEFEIPRDLEEAVILDAIQKARERIVEEAVKEYVEKNLQYVVKNIDMESLHNLVYLQAAKCIAEKMTK